MNKMFDITPPKPKIQNKKSVKSKNKKKSNGLIFIIVLLIFVIYFSLNNKIASNYQEENNTNEKIKSQQIIKNNTNEIENENTNNQKTLSTPNPKTTGIDDKENEEIANEEIDFDENIEIEILNGAYIPGLANEVKNILEKNNIQVDNIGNTKNLYDRSIIYYQKINIKLAEKLKEILISYNPIIQENDEFASNNKILIVVVK